MSLGTVRRCRIPTCKLSQENKLKKEPRGASFGYVCDIDGVKMSNVIWKDNKLVTLLSRFTGVIPIDETKRYDRKEKNQKICPAQT